MYMHMHLYSREFAFVYMHKCKRSFLCAFACVCLHACLRAELNTNAKRVCAQNISTCKHTLGSETFRMYYRCCFFNNEQLWRSFRGKVYIKKNATKIYNLCTAF